MSEPTTATDAKTERPPVVKPKPKKKRRKPRSTVPGDQMGSRDAKRIAAVVLEVFAGARTPTEAAEALSVSANRYYQLEARALQGMIGACEPRPKGKVVSPEKQLARLRREADKLRGEAARYQALARASQRTIGIAPPKPTRAKKGGRRKCRRKPTVRALTVAKSLAPANEPATPRHEMPVVPPPTVTTGG